MSPSSTPSAASAPSPAAGPSPASAATPASSSANDAVRGAAFDINAEATPAGRQNAYNQGLRSWGSDPANVSKSQADYDRGLTDAGATGVSELSRQTVALRDNDNRLQVFRPVDGALLQNYFNNVRPENAAASYRTAGQAYLNFPGNEGKNNLDDFDAMLRTRVPADDPRVAQIDQRHITSRVERPPGGGAATVSASSPAAAAAFAAQHATSVDGSAWYSVGLQAALNDPANAGKPAEKIGSEFYEQAQAAAGGDAKALAQLAAWSSANLASQVPGRPPGTYTVTTSSPPTAPSPAARSG